MIRLVSRRITSTIELRSCHGSSVSLTSFFSETVYLPCLSHPIENPFGQRCFLCCTVDKPGGDDNPFEDKCRLRMVEVGPESPWGTDPVLLVFLSPFPILSQCFQCHRDAIILSAKLHSSLLVLSANWTKTLARCSQFKFKLKTALSLPVQQWVRSTLA